MANIYLDADNVDDLGRMVAALLSELWIMRDRMFVMEALLEKANVATPEQIESYVFTPAQELELEKLRDRVMASVVGAPIAAREHHVHEILGRAGFENPVG